MASCVTSSSPLVDLAFSGRLGAFPDHGRVAFRLMDGCLHLAWPHGFAERWSFGIKKHGFLRQKEGVSPSKNQDLTIGN